MSTVDCVIIGGGLSGLCAASWFAWQYSPAYFEDGTRIDLGGAYVGGGQNRILRIADSLGVDTFPAGAEGKSFTVIRGKRWVHHSEEDPSLDLLSSLDAHWALREWDKLAQKVSLDETALSPQDVEFDRMSCQEWIKANMWTGVGKSIAAEIVKSGFCAHPCQVSMLAHLQAIKGVGNLDMVLDDCQEFKFVGGSQQISEKLGEQLGPSRIMLGGRVTTRSGFTVQCKRIIVAMAPFLYGRIQFDPPLPPLRYQLCQHCPEGSVIKTIMFYSTAWWREAGLAGSFFTDKGPVTFCQDDTQPDGSHPAIIGFIVADHARKWMTKSKKERRVAIAEQYRAIFGISGSPPPIEYAEHDWSSEEFSAGGYGTAQGPRVLSELGFLDGEPMGCVHFAGTDTAAIMGGYMDGAVESGERTGYEVANALAAEGYITLKQRLADPTAPEPEHYKVKLHPPRQLSFLERNAPSVGVFLSVSALALVATLGLALWLLLG